MLRRGERRAEARTKILRVLVTWMCVRLRGGDFEEAAEAEENPMESDVSSDFCEKSSACRNGVV